MLGDHDDDDVDFLLGDGIHNGDDGPSNGHLLGDGAYYGELGIMNVMVSGVIYYGDHGDNDGTSTEHSGSGGNGSHAYKCTGQ